jgi:hypothetical protein
MVVELEGEEEEDGGGVEGEEREEGPGGQVEEGCSQHHDEAGCGNW